MIHATIWSSGQVARLSRDARLLFVGLIVLGDDDGRLKADPRLIRSQIFPYDDDVKVADVSKWMKEITDQKLVIEYEVEGERYMFHPKWENYQMLREDRRRESNIPAPLFEFSSPTTNGQPNDNQASTKSPRKISKDKVSKEKGIDTSVESDKAFATFWDKYPKKVGKKAAWKAWQKIKWTPELNAKITQGLENAILSDQWSKDQGRYIPHAATWLNGERWDDDYRVSRSRSSKYDNIGTTTKA